jgi:hypothetical protein
MFVIACKKWQISPFAFLSNLMGFCTSTTGQLPFSEMYYLFWANKFTRYEKELTLVH